MHVPSSNFPRYLKGKLCHLGIAEGKERREEEEEENLEKEEYMRVVTGSWMSLSSKCCKRHHLSPCDSISDQHPITTRYGSHVESITCRLSKPGRA